MSSAKNSVDTKEILDEQVKALISRSIDSAYQLGWDRALERRWAREEKAVYLLRRAQLELDRPMVYEIGGVPHKCRLPIDDEIDALLRERDVT